MENKGPEKQKFTVNPLKLWRDLKDAFLMFFSAVRGKYPFPKRSLVWLILFAIYAVIPFDLIPDPLIAFFGFGAADDLFMLVYVLNKMSPDLEKFRYFKNTKFKEGSINVEVVGGNDEKNN